MISPRSIFLFPCKKTILGDVNQTVSPFSSSDSDTISKVFPGAGCMRLNKSYRSTYEIAQFAQTIQPAAGLEVIERHGEHPVVEACRIREVQLAAIKEEVAGFPGSPYNSMGIICKTQKQADKLYEALKDAFPSTLLLTSQSASFTNGVIVTSAHMAKGLEFDQVIIPDADKKNYHSIVDRGLLYIACTRAMHKLSVFYVKECTEFIAT
jgi:DNA helicase II / ATP-dependent DNA helicase PcrA